MDLLKIALKIEKELCLVHNENPVATPRANKIELKCCCEEFKVKLVEKIKNEIAIQTKTKILNSFKFKK